MNRRDRRHERVAGQPGLVVDRRSFFKLLPALGAAGWQRLTLKRPHGGSRARDRRWTAQTPQRNQESTRRRAVDRPRANDAQEAMALRRIATSSFEAVRKIDVLDTEPAMPFIRATG